MRKGLLLSCFINKEKTSYYKDISTWTISCAFMTSCKWAIFCIFSKHENSISFSSHLRVGGKERDVAPKSVLNILYLLNIYIYII